MGYEYICPKCKAHLDPGEKCDCESRVQDKKENPVRILYTREEFHRASRAVCV